MVFEIPPLELDEDAVATSLYASRLDHRPRVDWKLDSEEERQFISLLQTEMGSQVSRWVYPQPSIGALTGDPTDQRRADFLIATPWAPPLVVEIDGLQHRAALEVDATRDDALESQGIGVVRIAAQAIRQGKFPNLAELIGTPQAPGSSREVDILVHGPAQTTRLGLALAEAVERGWLEGAGEWVLHVEDSLGIARAVIPSLLELFASIDELWAGYLAPDSVQVHTPDGNAFYRRVGVATYEQGQESISGGVPSVTILLEHDRAPADDLPDSDHPVIVARPATLPVRLAERRAEGSRLALAKDPKAMGEALQRVLQFVFGKKEFREGQLEALSQALQRRDCLVLLPTGAGKSLVYQLAGLLLPGRTLVVDPIVALMEDQVESLRRSGIDRAVGISSFVTQQGLSESALAMVQSGDALFCFIAPERLQQASFRDALQALTVSVPINLAVVDEAHCISEWGHDFRPAYLNMGPLLRRLCRAPDGSSPPILALTGTASRAVLRDVMIELDLDRSDPNGVVKPDSFARPELSFEIIVARPGEPSGRLIGLLQALPGRLRIPDLYRPGRGRHLGIVFCPHVNGELGVVNVAKTIRSTVTPYVDYYAGSAPRGHDYRAWNFDKRRTASRFREGDTLVLCATNAFGMGVDIPNVRFTIHYGIPGSLEAFYQEAGRAGRDRRPSHCGTIFTELDPRLSERLLSDSYGGEVVREMFRKREGGERDDILNQLWFHFNTFQGADVEQAALNQIVDQTSWDGTARTVTIPFSGGDDQSAQERALIRLHQVGMVADYLKDWGSRKFTLHLSEARPEDLDRAFLRFVSRTQPGKLDERRSALEQVRESSLSGRASALATMAMDMVYDSVEKSRRRALREMRLLAAESRSSAEIQRRIEDYFREGELAPVLESLTEAGGLTLDGWFDVYRTQTRTDEGELRGSTARLLESYPDHPGLLLGRALAELMAGASEFEFRDNLTRAFSYGRERYGMTPTHAEAMFRFVLEQATTYHRGWRPLVWLSWDEGFGSTPVDAETEALQSSQTTAGELVFVLERRLRRIVEEMDQLAKTGGNR